MPLSGLIYIYTGPSLLALCTVLCTEKLDVLSPFLHNYTCIYIAMSACGCEGCEGGGSEVGRVCWLLAVCRLVENPEPAAWNLVYVCC